jgi:phosphoribosylaminoimidazolecarboxamide formyltransferase / IMP cyclohydrolase
VIAKRALLSVTDKSGLLELAGGLVALGFEIVSTGGTAKAIRDAGFPVQEVADVTGFPEMLDGRVKTLHPKIHGGLLGDVRKPEHAEEMRRAGIVPFGLVAVNLYPFEKTVAGQHRFDQAIESIDVGGPAMIRASAKNHENVLVVVDPADYPAVLKAIEAGQVGAMRTELAAKAYAHTAYYDSVISRYLTGLGSRSAENSPNTITLGLRHDGLALRYGENPHQTAGRYLDPLYRHAALQPFGEGAKEISYNNWLDADAAWGLACDLPPGACVIVKHGNPCGAAVEASLAESYRSARAADPISAFGGIVAFHGPLDEGALEAMAERGNFLEVVVSAGWEDESLEKGFRARSNWAANARFLVGDPEAARAYARENPQVRSIFGGALVQTHDLEPGTQNWEVATRRAPSPQDEEGLRFLWKVVPHVKSNAIVVGRGRKLLGVGAGQMNRVQSVRLALEQAGDQAKGACLASDAFFPFPDSIEAAARAGIRAVVQPGGSKKDAEVIAAADEHDMAMVFTTVRHFRH